jgi:hypothetical protein
MSYIIVMNKKRILPELNAISTVFLIGAVALLLCIPGSFYGPPDLNNPFFIAACSLSVQVLLRGVMFEPEEKKDLKVKNMVMVGPVNLVTGILILLLTLPSPIPSNIFLILLITVISGAFLWFGVRDTFFGAMYLRLKHQDSREFRRAMEELAEAARREKEFLAEKADREEALVADLAEFFAGVGPTGNTESRDN